MKVLALLGVGLLACVSFVLVDDSQMRGPVFAAASVLLSHIANRVREMALQHFGERHRLLINTTVTTVCVIASVSLMLAISPLEAVGLVFLVTFGVSGVAYGVYLYMRRLFGILLH